MTVEEALEANAARAAVDGARFMQLYGLLPEDPEPYTHVIEATNLNAHEIVERVVLYLEAKK